MEEKIKNSNSSPEDLEFEREVEALEALSETEPATALTAEVLRQHEEMLQKKENQHLKEICLVGRVQQELLQRILHH